MELENNNITLWHGGRDLHLSYHKPKVCAKGRWEHGPGLYLTTNYETARKYAKGGGTTYQVELELGTHIKNVTIHIDNVLEFVKNSVIRSKQKHIIEDLHNNMKRSQTVPFINAEIIVNLCVNYEALKGEQTIALNRFLVNNNVDYGTEHNFGGRGETVCIVYNLDKIKKVKQVKSKDVLLSEYELLFPAIYKKNQNRL